MPIDFEAEGLLDGLADDHARRARLDLLEELTAAGVPLDELRRACAEDRLAFVGVERELSGEGGRYTAAEVAERAGSDVDFLRAARRALGLADADPDDAVFTDADVEAARAMQAFRDAGMPDEGLIESSRVIGHGMSQIAVAGGEIFAASFFRPGDTERDTAARYAEMTRRLYPRLASVVEHVLRLHQREQVRNAAVGWAEMASGRLAEGRQISVCFADLVGFTRLGEEVPADALGALAGRFNDMALEVASPRVRLVKMIGDAAMLVSTEPEPLVDAGLRLIEAAQEESDDFPQIRVGVACGEALSRAGDWYGRPVNLASRVTAIARRGSMLATEELRRSVDGDYSWSEAGLFRIKGVRGRVPLFRVRRAQQSEAPVGGNGWSDG